MMVLQGLRWSLQGRDIHKDSVRLTTSIMVQHQLQMSLRADPTASPTPGTVRLHQYNFYNESDMNKVVSDLLSGVQHGPLCVLMDETGADSLSGTAR